MYFVYYCDFVLCDSVHIVMKISALIKRFSSCEPVFVIIDVRQGISDIPTTAYEAVEEVESNGKEIHRIFKHILCSIEAEEAEEVRSKIKTHDKLRI